jgi:hypothetical protein
MRCTKCSFISFDDLSACAKCASDLSLLSKELNGTCIETRQEFFLGSAIQTAGLDEDSFSDSQMLPPIDHSDMNFDDTSTGGFSPISPSLSGTSAGFDDSVGVSGEDDVAIELGDIMPIDLDQLDAGPVLPVGSLESTDALPFDDFSFDSDKTNTLGAQPANEIDFDLTGGDVESISDFNFDDDLSGLDLNDSSIEIKSETADDGASLFDRTSMDSVSDATADAGFELDKDLLEQLSDSGGSFDETLTLGADVAFDDTRASLRAISEDEAAPLELDESLVAELAGTSSLDFSGEFPVEYSDEHSASGEFGLDDALVAELASGDKIPVAGAPSDVLSGVQGPQESAGDFGFPLEFEAGVVGGEAPSMLDQVEDLTGEFPPIREDDETEFAGLDLADIDVSDLVDVSMERIPDASADNGLLLGHDSVGMEFSGPISLTVEDTEGDITSSVLDLDSGVDDNSLLDLGLEMKNEDGVGDLSGVPEIGLSSFSPDDTFREAAAVDVSADDASLIGDSLAAQSAQSLDGSELEEDGDLSSIDIDALSLDTDFEAFLDKRTGEEELPEIELISDDDQEGPPDLPS